MRVYSVYSSSLLDVFLVTGNFVHCNVVTFMYMWKCCHLLKLIHCTVMYTVQDVHCASLLQSSEISRSHTARLVDHPCHAQVRVGYEMLTHSRHSVERWAKKAGHDIISTKTPQMRSEAYLGPVVWLKCLQKSGIGKQGKHHWDNLTVISHTCLIRQYVILLHQQPVSLQGLCSPQRKERQSIISQQLFKRL